jgi:hypothetical protein
MPKIATPVAIIDAAECSLMKRAPQISASLRETGEIDVGLDLIEGIDIAEDAVRARIADWARVFFQAAPLLHLHSANFTMTPSRPVGAGDELDVVVAFTAVEAAILRRLQTAPFLEIDPEMARVVLAVSKSHGNLFVQPERTGRSTGTEIDWTKKDPFGKQILGALGPWLHFVDRFSFAAVFGDGSAHDRLALHTHRRQAARG